MTDERAERLRRKRRERHYRVNETGGENLGWHCGIGTCSHYGQTVTDLITHQIRDHPSHTCKVCDKDVPDGFLAIYHGFETHSRTEYVRAYGASAEEVRQREQVKQVIEERVDVSALLEEIEG